jgi:hypothetical protein
MADRGTHFHTIKRFRLVLDLVAGAVLAPECSRFWVSSASQAETGEVEPQLPLAELSEYRPQPMRLRTQLWDSAADRA